MADKIYRAAFAELFSDKKDVTFVIKWREIYEYMESAIYSCEDIANILEGVALKYASIFGFPISHNKLLKILHGKYLNIEYGVTSANE